MLKITTKDLLMVAKANKYLFNTAGHSHDKYRKRVYYGLKYYRSVGLVIGTDYPRNHYYIVHTASGNRKIGWG